MIDAIAELWAENKSLSEIGAVLAINRNAVAGLVDRAQSRRSEICAKAAEAPGAATAEQGATG
jgi:DNA-binding CsgD family transcriptional regulator